MCSAEQIEEEVDEAYQGSDIDKTLEDVQDFIEDPNPIDDMMEDVEEEYDKLQDVGDQVVSDAEDAADALQNELSNALTNTGTIATNASNALMASLGIGQNRGPNDDQMNAMASMEGDPRLASLMARMRRRRKQGKSQLRKGGGLYIPLKAGIQVQT
jgi:uncharacterized phage infection (PIP) family protein YhgE